MKIVVNSTYGVFFLPECIAEKLNCCRAANSIDIRTNEELIDWVNTHSNETDLRVVELPENATDWQIIEYDGLEYIIAVVDGKLIRIYGIKKNKKRAV